MAIVSLEDGITDAQKAVQARFVDATDNLYTILETWLSALSALLDQKDATDRTVSNWVAVGRALQSRIPPLKANQTQQHANMLSDFLHRTCCAGAAALAAGRITNAVSILFINSYNGSWAL